MCSTLSAAFVCRCRKASRLATIPVTTAREGSFATTLPRCSTQAQCWSVNGSLRLRRNGDRTFLMEANLLYF